MTGAHYPHVAVENPDEGTDIGTVVKLLIEAHGGDYTEVANALVMSRSSLSERITGKRQWKGAELSALARFFSVSPSVFFIPPRLFFTHVPDHPIARETCNDIDPVQGVLWDGLVPTAA